MISQQCVYQFRFQATVQLITHRLLVAPGVAGRMSLAVLLSVADTLWHVDLHGLPAGRLQQLCGGPQQPVQARHLF